MSAKRPSHATVVAYLALFVAIGGTAAALPGQNSVNTGDVKNETLKSQDLKNGAAVRSSDVSDDSLAAGDLAPGSVGSSEVAADSLTTTDLANDSVFNGEIGNNAVGTSEIDDLSVATADLTGGAVTSAKVGNNAVGSGDLATITVSQDPTPFDFGDQDEGNNDYLYGTSIADCPAGSTVIGGGAKWLTGWGGVGGDELQAITEVRLASNGIIAMAVSDVDNDDFTALAYCLSTGA